MIKGLSLKAKTFILLFCIVLLATVPLIVYYVKTAHALSALGEDPVIESVLTGAVDNVQGSETREAAASALKRYQQITVLKDAIVSQVLLFSLVYFGCVVCISLIVGYFFISRITKPLANLTGATQQLARDNLDYTIPEDTGGEIGQLIRSFNTMAEKLSVARREKLIAERKAMWQRVARVIAHEIKNPLTPIKLSTERMYEKYLTESKDFPEVIKSTTSTILSEIGNLQNLVDTFHTYAKFPDPVLKDEKLNDVIRDSVALFGGDKVAITCDLADTVPILKLDRRQMGEALNNLIKNSIEAIGETDHEGTIEMKSFCENGTVIIEIADNGCGITKENMERLFQPYFTTKKHGNGIGLALTERIINLHGGKIAVESNVGEGCRFTIRMTV
ncbi:MAG: HAMP domain-containing protein [Chitinivibrionales bacterium]|nr:HAMP domain-containing protein [Chitinivibrionales bacterium]